MKSGVSPQKLQKYRRWTPIWALICTPVAPSLLISLGHSPRLGGHNFRLGGHKQSFGGHGPGMPPRGAGSDILLAILQLKKMHCIVVCQYKVSFN